jgi:hypothetical protein
MRVTGPLARDHTDPGAAHDREPGFVNAAILQTKRLRDAVFEKDVSVGAAAAQRARQKPREKIMIEAGMHARRFVRSVSASPGAARTTGKVSVRLGLKRASDAAISPCARFERPAAARRVMLPGPSIVAALRNAASAQREILEAIKHTRTAIVALGGELAALIAALPPEDVGAIALGVVVVMRGTPTVDDIPGLTAEYLPALDDESHETRPGATSLYLEALGKGQSRVFVELRSTPGQIVLATSSLHDLDAWLDAVRGIVIDADSRVRLIVEQRLPDDDVQMAVGPDAPALLTSFLESLATELKRRARFNRAVDL